MGGLGGDTPSFDGLLDSCHPKDTEVIITEEDSPASAAQGCAAGSEEAQGSTDNSITLAAHWVVLWGLSPYFRAKLDRWSSGSDVVRQHSGQPQQQQQQQQQQQDVCNPSNNKKKKKKKKNSDQGQQPQQQQQQQQQPYQYSLQLLVPPGQLELGRRLVSAMYSSSPALSDLEAPQLMQLVALAECYGVGKVVTAAAAQLEQFGVETMPLATAAAVFELPEACLGLKAFAEVHKTAADKLQQELGDLEVVWGDKGKQQALLGLSFAALLRLLVDGRTQVTSEDTAVYTAGRWLQEHPHALSQQQLGRLVHALILPYCTPTYLASVVAPAASWLRKAGLTEAEALALCTLPGFKTDQRAQRLKSVCGTRICWQMLPVRLPSPTKVLHVQWKLPLSTLEEVARSGDACRLQPEESRVTWCGRSWGLRTTVQRDCLELFLEVFDAPAGCDAKYSVIAANGPWVSRSTSAFVESGWGYPKMLDWGADKDWPEVLEWLEQQKLVHPDKCLHLRIAVSQVC